MTPLGQFMMPIKNGELNISTMLTPFVASHHFVAMLSDSSTLFGVGYQDGLVTQNRVETSVTVRDVSTPFIVNHLMLAR
jgi:hypothetical protein